MEERPKSHALSPPLASSSPPRGHKDRAWCRCGGAHAMARSAGRAPAGAARQDDDPGMGRPRGTLGRLGSLEPVLDRLQPPEWPEPDLRTAGVLQRLRRQDCDVARRELRVYRGIQAPDDQDAFRHQLERRPAFRRGRRRLHAQFAARPWPQGALGGSTSGRPSPRPKRSTRTRWRSTSRSRRRAFSSP